MQSDYLCVYFLSNYCIMTCGSTVWHYLMHTPAHTIYCTPISEFAVTTGLNFPCSGLQGAVSRVNEVLHLPQTAYGHVIDGQSGKNGWTESGKYQSGEQRGGWGGRERDGMTDDEGRAGSWFHDCWSPSEPSSVAHGIANEICAFSLLSMRNGWGRMREARWRERWKRKNKCKGRCLVKEVRRNNKMLTESDEKMKKDGEGQTYRE